MKQLPMTPALSALITGAVGEDVDTSKLSVFETIALNTLPLPGKQGSLFEGAVVEPITLLQMVDSVNSGNHLPLIADHEMMGAPKGRAFHAGLNYGDDGVEMRQLFYLDETEGALISKLDAGSLDEVSVSFLSTQFLCSACGFDYMEEGDSDNVFTRTCGNGHEIGTDGVHGRMVGLNQFIELSLVARGAADKPKIVGKSASKLAPETTLRLAAKGFEPHALVVQASRGKEMTMDTAKLVADFATATASVATLTLEKGQAETRASTLEADLATARTRVGELETELAAEKAKQPEGADEAAAVLTERDEAVELMQGQLNNLLVATGKPKLEGDALPAKVADLKAQITAVTADLTAILPVDGVSKGAAGDDKGEAKLGFNLADAFGLRK